MLPPQPKVEGPLPPPFLLVAFKGHETDKFLLPLGAHSFISRVGGDYVTSPAPTSAPPATPAPVAGPAPAPGSELALPTASSSTFAAAPAPAAVPVPEQLPPDEVPRGKKRTRASVARPPPPKPEVKKRPTPPPVEPTPPPPKHLFADLPVVPGMTPAPGTVLLSTYIPVSPYLKPDWATLAARLPFNNSAFVEKMKAAEQPQPSATEAESEPKVEPVSPKRALRRIPRPEELVRKREYVLNVAAESWLPEDGALEPVTIRLIGVDDRAWKRVKGVLDDVEQTELDALVFAEPEIAPEVAREKAKRAAKATKEKAEKEQAEKTAASASASAATPAVMPAAPGLEVSTPIPPALAAPVATPAATSAPPTVPSSTAVHTTASSAAAPASSPAVPPVAPATPAAQGNPTASVQPPPATPARLSSAPAPPAPVTAAVGTPGTPTTPVPSRGTLAPPNPTTTPAPLPPIVRETWLARKKASFASLLQRVGERRFPRFRLETTISTLVDFTSDKWAPRPYHMTTRPLYARDASPEDEDDELPRQQVVELELTPPPDLEGHKRKRKEAVSDVTFEMPVSLDALDERVEAGAARGLSKRGRSRGRGAAPLVRKFPRGTAGALCEGCARRGLKVWRRGPGGRGTRE